MAFPENFLHAYRTPAGVFIETGTHMGEGVQAALDAGFGCIHTCELSPFCFGYCTRRFEDVRDKVHLHWEDSRDFLRKTLGHLTTRATFWLDAHFCGGDSGSKDDVPLLKELRILSQHHIRDHVLLIDDVRLMGSRDLSPSLMSVMMMVRAVNPHYQIQFASSKDFQDDILIALPPE